MCNFKVGDRVKIVKNSMFVGRFGTITAKMNQVYNWYVDIDDNSSGTFFRNEDLQKIGDTMSKYDELKNRIKALHNGWDKEADDILNEIADKNKMHYYINIGTSSKNGSIEIQDNTSTKMSDYFNFKSQCEKMKAFKQALMWLLDHSEIKKDEKQDKIKALEEQVKDIQRQIEEIK